MNTASGSPVSRLLEGLPQPRLAIVLGSGLGHPPPGYIEWKRWPYDQIFSIRKSSISGHAHFLSLGLWNRTPVLLFFGRLHYYEGYSFQQTNALVHLAAHWNVPRIVLTNAAGSLTPELKPGNITVIKAHYILVGNKSWKQLIYNTPNERPYTHRLLQRLSELPQGLYVAVSGPSYETPAEVQALARCHAHMVGMSTAWESEEAWRLGLEVAALSCITNYAAGIQGSTPHHQEVLEVSRRSYETLYYHISKLIEW
jgi:purine-nucleoside phosphorylase